MNVSVDLSEFLAEDYIARVEKYYGSIET